MEQISKVIVKKLLEEKELINSRLELNISGNNINHTILNTIRRIGFSEIPIYVFSNINIIENTTIFNNNYIKLRIKNLPVFGIKSDKIIFKENINIVEEDVDTGNIINMDDINLQTDFKNVNINSLDKLTMYIDVSNNTNIIKTVGTDDCKFYYKDKEIKSPYPINIPIIKLQEGQHIKLNAITELGIEKTHDATHSPVSVLYFNKNNENDYKLILESRGQLTEYEILNYIMVNINNQLELLKEKINLMDDIDNMDEGVIEIDDFDHTIGNLISDGLRMHKFVLFGGYSMPHLLDEKIKISFKIKSNNIKKILFDVTNYYEKLFKTISDIFLKLE